MESEWQKYAISDVMYIIGGGTPKRSISEYWNGDIPWLSVADFNTDDRHVSKTKETITDLGLQKSSTKLLDSGQLIISARGTVGALAQLDKPMTFNQSCYGLNAKTEYVTNDYLYYLVKKKVRDLQKITHGAVFDTITKDTFKDIEVQLPSLLTQKKIAHILSTLDDKIELNSKMNQTLEEMAQALFKSWFVDFDPVHAKANASSDADYEQIAKELGISRKVLDLFPDKFEESGLGMIPTGWEVKKFGDIVIPKKGKSITKKTIIEGDVPVVAGGLTPAYYHNQFNVEAPVITISASGANAGFVNLYNTNIWASDCSYINSTNSDYVLTHYIYLRLKQSEITWMQQGAAQPHIYPSHLMRLDIVDAGTKIWDDFENLLTLMFKKIAINKTEAQTLQKIRDTLLPKLLSGELDVSELELDNVTH